MNNPTNFYIASRLENAPQVQEVAGRLKDLGMYHTYDWTTHGSVQGRVHSRIRQVACLELEGVRDADIVVVILPGGRGTHAELGMALAMGKQVVVCAPDNESFLMNKSTCVFYWHSSCIHSTGSIEDWVACVKGVAHLEQTCPKDKYTGLKNKYRVYNTRNNQPVENCFVLRPDKDPTALQALKWYAVKTNNEQLASDLCRWIRRLENKD